MLDTQDLV